VVAVCYLACQQPECSRAAITAAPARPALAVAVLRVVVADDLSLT